MLKTSRSATLLSIFIITSLSLTGCSWRQFKQSMGWCKRNCDDILGSITPPKPRPTIQPGQPVVIPSPNLPSTNPSKTPSEIRFSPKFGRYISQPLNLYPPEIRVAANTAALNHLLQKNDQATFDELKLVAEQEARKEAFRRGVIISGTGFSTIGAAAAKHALDEKARRG